MSSVKEIDIQTIVIQSLYKQNVTTVGVVFVLSLLHCDKWWALHFIQVKLNINVKRATLSVE